MIFRIIFFVLFLLNQSNVFCSFKELIVEKFDERINEQIKENRITNSVILGAIGDALGASIEFDKNIDNILKINGYEKDFLEDNFQSVTRATKNHYTGLTHE